MTLTPMADREIKRALAGYSVRQLTKDTLQAAMDKDIVDAYFDVKLAADLLKARMDEALGADIKRFLDIKKAGQ